MKPLRIRIDRIVDFGTIVSLVGIDTKSDLPVTIHVDHRPFAAFWNGWWQAGLPQPVEYDADRLMLHLDMLPADDADGVELIECDSSAAVTSNAGRQPVQEIEP
jgi:hypothetical protein